METNTAIRHDAGAAGPIAMAFSGTNGLVSPLEENPHCFQEDPYNACGHGTGVSTVCRAAQVSCALLGNPTGGTYLRL
jgi:hypothetical protein